MAPSLVAPSSVLQLNLSSGFYTVIVFFFAFLCFVLLWGYCRRGSSGHRTAAATAAALHGHRLMQQLQHHPHGRFFPTAASTPLPSMPYGSIKGVRATETGNPPEDCVVCLTKFEEGEDVKVIPMCAHVFHPQCIDRWLVLNDSCPLCRCCSISVSEMAATGGSTNGGGGGGGGGGEEEERDVVREEEVTMAMEQIQMITEERARQRTIPLRSRSI
ncbi:E3 ubiquitin-protein ligase ATL4 [Ananas comosus]|uniref:E3 ubiquitin-protein ligase ATL4 n=1 Tax=Ananas comosus TaxID=4615 RepID=A0A199UGB4_ANACO|nr:E3 ubiquitin-protein ligase ATL4 [Ananas comosus]